MACTFQATIDEKFTLLIGLGDEDMDINTMITTYNTAVTGAACDILRKERCRKKPWVTKDALDLRDDRRHLKKKRYEAEGVKEFSEENRRIQKGMKEATAKADWIGAQCKEIEICLNKNNSMRAYQLVRDLILEKQGMSSTIQDRSGKCLTEEQEILSRWTEYCSDCTTMRVVVKTQYWKKGKSAGADNTPAELVQAGGETMIKVLTLLEMGN